MKKSVWLLLFLLVFLCACGLHKQDTRNAYEKVNDMLTNLKSYRSCVKIKYISNKNTNTYDMIQQCKASGEYKLELKSPENVAGNITLFDGNTIYQFNAKTNDKISIAYQESMQRSELLLISFVKNYNQSLKTCVSIANINKNKYTILDAEIPGEHPYFNSERLFVNNNTLAPEELIIYDKNKSERIIITFENFEYNIELKDSIFKI